MANLPSPRPLSIKLIVMLYASLAIVHFFSLSNGVTVFGFFDAVGQAGTLIHSSLIFLCSYLVLGLWRLSAIARRVAITYASYDLLNGCLMIINLTGRVTSAHEPDYVRGFIVGIVAVIVMFGVVVWFLITRKAAFGKSITPPPAP